MQRSFFSSLVVCNGAFSDNENFAERNFSETVRVKNEKASNFLLIQGQFEAFSSKK